LKVEATSVKLEIPPPINRALFRPSGFAVAHCQVPQIIRSLERYHENGHFMLLWALK